MNIKLPSINAFALGLVILAFILGWQLGQRDFKLSLKDSRINLNLSHQQVPKNVNIDFQQFWDVWDLVSREYVDKGAIDPQKMYYGAIQGMVSALGDPYTVFLPPSAQKSAKEELGGSFEGVGIQLGYNKDKRLVVIAPLSGTPAERAGVKAGDIITKVDGKDTSMLTLPEAVNIIRGPKGSEVKIETYREGDKEPKQIALVRDTIIVKSVESSTKLTPKGKKVAYIKLSRFGEKTFEEWESVVSDVLASGSSGVILDLRNNPGGYLEGAVFIASEFLPSGIIVQQENSAGEKTGYRVNRTGKLLSLPLITLINKGSASASEIVAGALIDNKRTILVGEQSFGKGTIQSTQDLANGTGIHITTAKWLTPNGTWVHDKGLTPEYVIDEGDDETKDPQLTKALELFDQ